MTLGLLSTVMDLAAVPNTETRRANASEQRVIIDPATGVVAGLSEGDTPGPEQPFDVVPDVPGEPPEPNAETPAEATPPEATPEASGLPEGLPLLRSTAPASASATIARDRNSLISAPAPEVTEKLADGSKLPKRGDTDATPLSIYSQPFVRKPEQQRVAIVILDAGLNASSLPLLTSLPRQVSVAVSPYTRHADAVITQLRNRGQETWAMLPVMTERYPEADPGPLGLIANMPRDEQLRRLRAAMSATLGSVGFVLPMDESYSLKKEAFAATLKEIDARGMVVLSTNASRSVEQLTADKNLQSVIRRADLVIDATPNEAVIRSTLAGLAATIKGKSDTIILASARPQTLLILDEWLQQNSLAPAELAPLSAIYLPDPVPVEAPAESGGHGEAPAHGAEAAKDAKPEAPKAAEKAEKPAAAGHH
ncbi:MAG: divergent polysaccharide deacetylase family protein [Rickettsiales bacterium]